MKERASRFELREPNSELAASFERMRDAGELEIRHHLLARLRVMGGHIGYHTHPLHRGKGVATYALREGLKILAHMGVRAALITCADSNAASARVIEKCGGIRVQDAAVAGFERRRRYVVPLHADHGGA